MKGAPESEQVILMRGVGLIIVAATLFTLDTSDPSALHQLVLPLLMAAGAALALRNLLAVALAVIALMGIRIDLGVSHWIQAIAYPAVVLATGIYVAVTLLARFRARIRATREEREARRRL